MSSCPHCRYATMSRGISLTGTSRDTTREGQGRQAKAKRGMEIAVQRVLECALFPELGQQHFIKQNIHYASTGAIPGRCGSPGNSQQQPDKRAFTGKPTPVDVLPDSPLNGTLRSLLGTLRPNLLTDVPIATVVKSLLQGIPLPSKDIVAMLRVPMLIGSTPNKRLRIVFRPEALVVEDLCLCLSDTPTNRLVKGETHLPHNLIHDLRNPHGMTRWTRPIIIKRPARRIRHMALMVGTIRVFPVPTRRKRNHRAHAPRTRTARQHDRIRP